jgi:putative transposase
MLTPLKKLDEYKWLNEVSAKTLQIVCRDLDLSFKSYFKKKGGKPKFSSKRDRKIGFPVNSQWFYFKDANFVKIEKLGNVKYKTDYKLTYGMDVKYSNPRISFENFKWVLTFCVEFENQELTLNKYSMGIDIGIKSTMVVAYGDNKIEFANINKSKKVRELKEKIKRLQRTICRKYECNRKGNIYIKTNNIRKLERKLHKLYSKLSNIRHNYIHQCTHKLISLFPKKVIMENLNVRGMLKNRHLSDSIQEQNFYEIIRQMEYKCKWNGI